MPRCARSRWPGDPMTHQSLADAEVARRMESAAQAAAAAEAARQQAEQIRQQQAAQQGGTR
ncbi:hypothetical protein Kpho02_59890 [Kitasatospora phosalacinea]|uniref:Uncharacterized protein n=1 Tax=Kitasatospora phosalacinea TaxID=2065 RepID=A0A9W6QDX1_9ACTN|nr:hypothetical protein Kpho02_59890 [Kitasatospora phosalacinea]